jgi:hypothetical protein
VALTLIVSSSNPVDIEFARSVCKALGGQLMQEPRLTTALSLAKGIDSNTGLIVGVENSFQVKQYREIFKTIDANRIHFIINPSDFETAKFAFSSNLSNNIILRRFDEIDLEGKHYAKVLSANFISLLPGLRNLLPTAHVRTLTLKELGQKDFIADTVFFQLQCLNCSERVAQTVANAVDELLLNAVFNAPIRESSQEKSNAPAEQTAQASIQMQIASEENYIAVAIIDKQGLFNRALAFKHLSSTYETTSAQEEDSSRIDGLGLSLILRSGASLRFLCSPGNFTEVSLLFKKTHRLLEFRSQFQFVSFVSLE